MKSAIDRKFRSIDVCSENARSTGIFLRLSAKTASRELHFSSREIVKSALSERNAYPGVIEEKELNEA